MRWNSCANSSITHVGDTKQLILINVKINKLNYFTCPLNIYTNKTFSLKRLNSNRAAVFKKSTAIYWDITVCLGRVTFVKIVWSNFIVNSLIKTDLYYKIYLHLFHLFTKKKRRSNRLQITICYIKNCLYVLLVFITRVTTYYSTV